MFVSAHGHFDHFKGTVLVAIGTPLSPCLTITAAELKAATLSAHLKEGDHLDIEGFDVVQIGSTVTLYRL